MGIFSTRKEDITLGQNFRPCAGSDGGVMSAESMSVRVLKGRRCSLFQVLNKLDRKIRAKKGADN